MVTHASTPWHADPGEPFDALARERLGIRARPEYSARAHLQDKFEHGYATPARSRQDRAGQFAAARAAERGEAAGLVSVPTTGKVPFAVAAVQAAEQLDCLLLTDEAKAKRRLAKLRCAVGFSARAHAVSENGHRSDVPWMVTLTYRPGVDWEPNHAKEALRMARNWARSKGFPFRYVWIAEIQDGKRRADGKGRDVIHYHVVIWLPVGVRCPHFDARRWWPHGMSQSLKARNSIGYLLHYLKKDKDLAAMPKGARAYGVGGLDKTSRRSRRWLGLPAFVQANSDVHDDWQRVPGGGWRDPHGEVYASEFERVKVGGIDALRRVCTHPRQIDAAGPFSWISRGPIGLAADGLVRPQAVNTLH